MLWMKVGSEFLVNTYTNRSQSNPSVTGLMNGNFVVNWESSGQDAPYLDIYGQIFTEAGVKVGSEFLVNTYTNSHQNNPSVTSLTNGNFVVTWESNGQDGSYTGVYGQIFTVSEAKVGSEFLVNTYTTSYQSKPSVTSLTNGNFVVTWESNGQDSSGSGVYGQIFTPTGAKVRSEFLVNTYAYGAQFAPSATSLVNGNFVVTWQSANQDGFGSGVYGQIFTPTGAKVEMEFLVNTYTVNDQKDPSVSSLSNGNFVVTWSSDGQDGSGFGVYGQIFTPTGAKVGSEFLVNTYTYGAQLGPSVTSLANGNFVVTWQSANQDGSGYGVFGQIFTATGTRVWSEFLVNTYTNDYQYNPSVTSLTNGNFVVTWESNGQDGSNTGLYGQILKPSVSVDYIDPLYTEDTTCNLADITVYTPYTLNITASLTLSVPAAGVLSTTAFEGSQSTYNPLTGIWEASGNIQTVNGLLSGIQFVPSANYNSNFTIEIVINDGTHILNNTMNVTGIPVNDLLVLQPGNTASSVYTEGDSPLAIDPLLRLTDVDDSIESATVSIGSGFSSAEDMLLCSSPNGILSNYNSLTGVLTLSSASSVTNYQAALRSVKYLNLSNNPSIVPRNISFAVNDGFVSVSFLKSIKVISVNTPPLIERNFLTINQGDVLPITSLNIDATDIETPNSLLSFSVNNVKQGYFERISNPGVPINNFFQSEIGQEVQFIHSGEPVAPSYDITVFDEQGASSGISSAAVTFIPSKTQEISTGGDDTIRNSLIGGAISGGVGLGFFALKLYLSRKADKSREKAFADNDEQLKKFKQEIVRPIALEIMRSIKMTNFMEWNSEKNSNAFVAAVGDIVDELKNANINIDLPKLDVSVRNRLINTIAHQTREKTVPKSSYSFYSSLTGYFFAEVTPEQIRDKAKEIAEAVKTALEKPDSTKNVSANQKEATLSNDLNAVEMGQLGSGSDTGLDDDELEGRKQGRGRSKFSAKGSMTEGLLDE